MSIFDQAFSYVMNNEASRGNGGGGVSAEPPIFGKDSAGNQVIVERPIARFGINSHAHPEASKAGFYQMTNQVALAYAENLYKKQYWDPLWLDGVKEWELGAKLLDIAINTGVHEAKLLLTRALLAVYQDGDKLTVDTLASVTYDELIPELVSEEIEFYTAIQAKHPERFSKHILDSWIARANKLPRPVVKKETIDAN